MQKIKRTIKHTCIALALLATATLACDEQCAERCVEIDQQDP